MVTLSNKNKSFLTDSVSLGGRIAFARKKLGLNQLEFAKKLGLETAVAISRYEKDLREPDVTKLVNISKLIECSLDWLLTGKGTPYLQDTEAKVDKGSDKKSNQGVLEVPDQHLKDEESGQNDEMSTMLQKFEKFLENENLELVKKEKKEEKKEEKDDETLSKIYVTSGERPLVEKLIDVLRGGNSVNIKLVSDNLNTVHSVRINQKPETPETPAWDDLKKKSKAG